MKMFEEWFWSKKKESEPEKKEKLTRLEEVQEEEYISKEEIQNAIDLYKNYVKRTIFYLHAFHSHNSDSIYFDKFILFYHKTTEQLYRIWKIKDTSDFMETTKEIFNFDKEFEEISRQYSGTSLFGINLSKMMFDITFWLNTMDPRSEKKNVYYYEFEDRPGFSRRYHFKNRILEEKKREKHKDVDPFNEEKWDK